MRWEAWPALLAALAWVVLLGALLVTYELATPFEWLGLLVIAGVPLALCLRALIGDWRKAEWSGLFPEAGAPVPAPWRQRLILGVALAVLLGAVGIDLATRPSSFDAQWFDSDPRLSITHLRPGTGEAWAYLVVLLLTLRLVASPTRRLGRALLLPAVLLGVAAVLGGALLVMTAGNRVDAAGISGDQTSCQRPDVGVGVPPHFPGVAVSRADGEIDGRALGTVNIRTGWGGVDDGVSGGFDSAWGRGIVDFEGSGAPLRYRDYLGLAALSLWIFHSDKTVVADDLGIDMVGKVALRHCSLVIDGRSAVLGFEALQWLMSDHPVPWARLGPSAPAPSDPGGGMEAWRGTVDYWIQPAQGQASAETGYRGLGFVSVTIDGQPPAAWPVTGLRATLRAWIWFPPTAP